MTRAGADRDRPVHMAGSAPGHPNDCMCSKVGCHAPSLASSVAVFGMFAWTSALAYLLVHRLSGPFDAWWQGMGISLLAGLAAMILTADASVRLRRRLNRMRDEHVGVVALYGGGRR